MLIAVDKDDSSPGSGPASGTATPNANPDLRINIPPPAGSMPAREKDK